MNKVIQFMKRLICLYDTAAKFYYDPRIVVSRGEAIRSFINEVNTKDSALNKEPQSFLLYDLGSFDELTGSFDTSEPVVLSRALDVKVSELVKAS